MHQNSYTSWRDQNQRCRDDAINNAKMSLTACCSQHSSHGLGSNAPCGADSRSIPHGAMCRKLTAAIHCLVSRMGGSSCYPRSTHSLSNAQWSHISHIPTCSGSIAHELFHRRNSQCDGLHKMTCPKC